MLIAGKSPLPRNPQLGKIVATDSDVSRREEEASSGSSYFSSTFLCMSPPCNLLSLKPINYFCVFSTTLFPLKVGRQVRWSDRIPVHRPLGDRRKQSKSWWVCDWDSTPFAAGRDRTWKYVLIVFYVFWAYHTDRSAYVQIWCLESISQETSPPQRYSGSKKRSQNLNRRTLYILNIVAAQLTIVFSNTPGQC